jgi:hypothetical protein
VDFLASIPLLVLNSLPHALALCAGAGLATGLGSFLNVLKVIKAVRIARVLRLLRIIKLLHNLRYAGSALAQRHVSTVATIAIAVVILWALAASALESAGVLPGLQKAFSESQVLRASSLTEGGAGPAGLARRAAAAAALDPTILLVRPQGGDPAWSRYSGEYYAAHFIAGDYGVYAANGVEVFLDERPVVSASALQGLVFFVTVVLLVAGFLLFYAPRFALDISDPVHVMTRGLSEPGYNLEVRVPPDKAEDEVFRLAALYNSMFLPLKDRAGGGQDESTPLRLGDIQNLAEGKEPEPWSSR